jgi:phospholipid/cholesterol/gamma-HCH transport system substrate-binding protein
MRHAIRKHALDFAAILGMVSIALAVAVYILTQQRLRFPVVQKERMHLKAEFATGQAVTPGQGQTVRVAGVKVGDIGRVELDEGRAVVTMDIDHDYDDLVHQNATALLRPKTGLKDMFVELDPGTPETPLLRNGDTIPIQSTAPDINADEVLSALDTDTRAYLQLLVNGLGKGLRGRSGDLREVFKRFEPIHRDIARVTRAVAARRQNLRRLVHNYNELLADLSGKDRQLTALVRDSDSVFRAFASQDRNISSAVAKLPGTLRETQRALVRVDDLGRILGPALDSVRPGFRELESTNEAVIPFARAATPILQKRIRPFIRTARPYVSRSLRPAAVRLSKAAPDLTASFHELNRLLNMLAHNPKGKESLSGNEANDLKRDEGYLFWLAWAVHNANSVFSTGDANGPFRRVLLAATCATIKDSFVGESGNPEVASAVLGVTDLITDPVLCGD